MSEGINSPLSDSYGCGMHAASQACADIIPAIADSLAFCWSRDSSPAETALSSGQSMLQLGASSLTGCYCLSGSLRQAPCVCSSPSGCTLFSNNPVLQFKSELTNCGKTANLLSLSRFK